MAAGVYCIQSHDGRRYIGGSVDIDKRWREHSRQLSTGKHHSKFMQRAWDKYGEGQFKFSVWIICAREDVLFYEQRCLDAFQPEYNSAPVAGSRAGCRHSDETRKKMSQSRRKDFSPMKGRTHTEEAKKKISENRKGKGGGPMAAERRAKIGAAHKGRVITPEQRAKISATLTGHKQGAEQIERRMAKLRGRKMPEGFAEATSARMTGVKLPPSHCESIGKSKAKLSDDQVRQIRLKKACGEKNSALSKEFGADPSSISEIVNGKSYRWVI